MVYLKNTFIGFIYPSEPSSYDKRAHAIWESDMQLIKANEKLLQERGAHVVPPWNISFYSAKYHINFYIDNSKIDQKILDSLGNRKIYNWSEFVNEINESQKLIWLMNLT